MRHVATTDGARLASTFRTIRADVGVREDFPPEVLTAAEAAAASGAVRSDREDLTHVPFVTLDPAASMDLDQAFHLERGTAPGAAWRVRYAIADVAAWVPPDGPVAAEASRRITTIYCPDRRVPLYPPVLSEGAASLLPDGPRPAVVWTLDVDSRGDTVAVDVRRAMVRSRAKLDYEGVQAAIDGRSATEPVVHLRAVGQLLLAAERSRGGMSLRVPEQEVGAGPDGVLELRFRRALPVEDWNAQLSLLTGRTAARMMLDARVGLLRTMPPADERDVARLRRVAHGLGIDWPADRAYGAMVGGLRADSPAHAAFLNEAGALFRGAGYVAFDGELPPIVDHAAIGAPYAHCTAPLRRLADRYVTEVCLSIAAGCLIPDATRAQLALLPGAMAEGTRRAGHVERRSVDVVEAAVLAPLVGRTFSASVVGVDEDGDGGEIAIPDLAVVARCAGRLPLGRRAEVVLESADAAAGQVRFRLAAETRGTPGERAVPGERGESSPDRERGEPGVPSPDGRGDAARSIR